MDTDQINENVRVIVAEKLVLAPTDVTPDSVLKELGADSLDVVEITMEIEDSFNISITDAEAAACLTVGRINELVSRKLAEKEVAR